MQEIKECPITGIVWQDANILCTLEPFSVLINYEHSWLVVNTKNGWAEYELSTGKRTNWSGLGGERFYDWFLPNKDRKLVLFENPERMIDLLEKAKKLVTTVTGDEQYDYW